MARSGRGPAGAASSVDVLVRPPCGDCNSDGSLDIDDAIALLFHLFHGIPMAAEQEDADVNSDGRLDVADAVGILFHLFVDSRAICP